MLNEFEYNAKWPEIKAGVRSLWGHLSEDEIEEAKSNLYDLSELIERRYQEGKKSIRDKIDVLLDSFDNPTDKNIDPDRSSYQRSPL